MTYKVMLNKLKARTVMSMADMEDISQELAEDLQGEYIYKLQRTVLGSLSREEAERYMAASESVKLDILLNGVYRAGAKDALVALNIRTEDAIDQIEDDLIEESETRRNNSGGCDLKKRPEGFRVLC